MRGPLDGVRVLDLTDEVGIYCTKLLAELGADVVRVESGEAEMRSWALPWVQFPDGERASAYYLWMNEGKRVIKLPEGPESASTVEQLALRADIVVESHTHAPSAGRVNYEQLRRKKAELIYVLITPFGSQGSKASWRGSNLVCLAAGGLLSLSGEPEREPLAPWGEQAFWAAGAMGALGALAAYYVRLSYGIGQRVEVSVQEAIAAALENAIQYLDLQGSLRKRAGAVGDVHRAAGIGFYPCRDGWIYLHAGLDERHWVALVQWLKACGLEEAEALSGLPWTDLSYRRTEQARREFDRIFRRFAGTRGKQELFEEGQRHRVPVSPVNTPLDVLRDPHLQERGFFDELELPGCRKPCLFPGPPFRFGGVPRKNSVSCRPF